MSSGSRRTCVRRIPFRRQPTVQSIELNDPGIRISKACAAIDDIVGNCETFLATRLSRQDLARLCDGFSVARHQATNLRFFVTIDDENSIDKAPQRGPDQQWHDDDLVRAAGLVGLPARFRRDARVQNGLEIVSRPVIRKDRSTHRRTIEIAVLVDLVAPEASPNVVESGLPGQDQVPGDNIGVNDRSAQLGKHVRDRRLAAGDAAGQADFQGRRGSRLAHLQEFVEVGRPDRVAP